MSFSDYLENVVMNFAFGKVLYFPPTELTLGLSRADPLDSGYGLNEPDAGDGYWRIPVQPIDWLPAYDGMVANSRVLTFPTATGDWGLITHFALFDSVAMTIYGELLLHQNVSTGQRPRFNPTKLEVFMD